MFNAGVDAVDLTRWKLNDGSNHALNVPPENGGTGSIVLASGAYALFVNNAANFLSLHAGIPSAVIDSVLSLTNTAGTVSLIDESGGTADSVSYTKDFGAAGDGNSLHRGSVSGTSLSAGPPSLGMGTLSVSQTGTTASTTQTSQTQTQTQTSSSQNTDAPTPSFVPPPLPEIFADAGDDRGAIVSADVEFYGRAYNRKREPISNVRFMWNFGDGATAEGEAVSHRFDYPGRYAVVLTIAQNRHAVADQIVVTAEPARLSFFARPDGSVEIINRAESDLDLSSWIVRSNPRDFRLPPSSIVLRGSNLRISERTLGFWSSPQTELLYPNGVLALQAGEVREEASAAELSAPPPVEPVSEETAPLSAPAPIAAAPLLPIAAAPQIETAETAQVQPELALEAAERSDVASSSAAAVSAAQPLGGSRWWLAALLLALTGGAAIYAVKRFSRGEWNIVEETGE